MGARRVFGGTGVISAPLTGVASFEIQSGVISLLSIRSKRSTNESHDGHENRGYRGNGRYHQDEPCNVSNHPSCSKRRYQPTSASAAEWGGSLRSLEPGIVGRHTLRLHEGNSDRPFERAMLMLRAVTIPFRQQSRMSRIAIVRRIESRLNPDLFSALRSSSSRLFLFPLWEGVSRHFHRVQCGLSPFYPSMSRRLLTPMRALPRPCADL